MPSPARGPLSNESSKRPSAAAARTALGAAAGGASGGSLGAFGGGGMAGPDLPMSTSAAGGVGGALRQNSAEDMERAMLLERRSKSMSGAALAPGREVRARVGALRCAARQEGGSPARCVAATPSHRRRRRSPHRAACVPVSKHAREQQQQCSPRTTTHRAPPSHHHHPPSTASTSCYYHQALHQIVHSWFSRKFATGCAILLPIAVTFYITYHFLAMFDGIFSVRAWAYDLDVDGVAGGAAAAC